MEQGESGSCFDTVDGMIALGSPKDRMMLTQTIQVIYFLPDIFWCVRLCKTAYILFFGQKICYRICCKDTFQIEYHLPT